MTSRKEPHDVASAAMLMAAGQGADGSDVAAARERDDLSAERRVRGAFRGGPLMLDAFRGLPRRNLIVRLDSDYVGSVLPRAFIDGVFLLIAQVTRRRYPLFLHGAQLLAAGLQESALTGWLSIEGWDDPGPLIRAWRARPGRMGLPSTDPHDPSTRLLARSAALLAVSPTLGGDTYVTLLSALEPDVAAAILGVVELWPSLRFRYAAMPHVAVETDPAIAPYAARLERLLHDRARVLRPTVVRAPALNESSESLLVADDVSATLLEHVPVGIIRLDSQGRVGYENPAMRALLGVPSDRPSPALGMRVLDLPNMRPYYREVDGLITEGRPFEKFRTAFTSIFGKKIVVNVVGRPFHAEGGERRGGVLMVVDATREEELEAQVLAMGRAEVLSSLVSRISHDLNNLLVGVRGHASILASAISATDPNHHAAMRLDEAAQRLSAVVDGLTALAHQEDQQTGAAIDVVVLVSEATAVIRDLIPGHIVLEVVTPSHPLPCRVPHAQLKHVLVNLGATARDAIIGWGDGRPGRITLRLSHAPSLTVKRSTGRTAVPLVPALATRSDEVSHGAIVLELTDDGIGMTDAQRAAIFDPIATNVADSVGRGLGLPVSHAIVSAYGGELVCRSAPGAGTTLTVRLPACDASAVVVGPTAYDRQQPPSTHVLVVEDNDIVRNLCIDVLESQRYRVTWVDSGRAALRLIANGGIDVALIDVGLPDISGLAVAAAITEMGHEVPVVLTSGNPPPSLRQVDSASRQVRFLRKPFQVRELLESIADAVRPV